MTDSDSTTRRVYLSVGDSLAELGVTILPYVISTTGERTGNDRPTLERLIERRDNSERSRAQVVLQEHYMQRISALHHIMGTALVGASRCLKEPIVLYPAANSVRQAIEAAVHLRHLLAAEGSLDDRCARYLADYVRAQSEIHLSLHGSRSRDVTHYQSLASKAGLELRLGDRGQPVEIYNPRTGLIEKVGTNVTDGASRWGFSTASLNHYRFFSMWAHGNATHDRMSVAGALRVHTASTPAVYVAIGKTVEAVLPSTLAAFSAAVRLPSPDVSKPLRRLGLATNYLAKLAVDEHSASLKSPAS